MAVEPLPIPVRLEPLQFYGHQFRFDFTVIGLGSYEFTYGQSWIRWWREYEFI